MYIYSKRRIIRKKLTINFALTSSETERCSNFLSIKYFELFIPVLKKSNFLKNQLVINFITYYIIFILLIIFRYKSLFLILFLQLIINMHYTYIITIVTINCIVFI